MFWAIWLTRSSFFGDQEGDFSLTIKSIKAVATPKDLERGFMGEKSESTEPSERRIPVSVGAKLMTALVLSIVTFGVCLVVCRWLKPSHHAMWRWH